MNAVGVAGGGWTEDELLVGEVWIAAVVEEEIAADRRNGSLAERDREETLITTEDILIHMTAYCS